jgi:hypothetical protein
MLGDVVRNTTHVKQFKRKRGRMQNKCCLTPEKKHISRYVLLFDDAKDGERLHRKFDPRRMDGLALLYYLCMYATKMCSTSS